VSPLASSCDLPLRNPITGIAGCCARAAMGHAAADPATAVMKSRRRITFPGCKATSGSSQRAINQEFAPGEMGNGSVCAAESLSRECPSWVKGDGQAKRRQASAAPPVAAVSRTTANWREVPRAVNPMSPRLPRRRGKRGRLTTWRPES
jgi:hypothetical protein